jgi:hypothetical protein
MWVCEIMQKFTMEILAIKYVLYLSKCDNDDTLTVENIIICIYM